MRGRQRYQSPSFLKYILHLSCRETQTALALCCLTDGAVSRGWSLSVPGCTAQRIIIHTTSVQASHRSTVSHPSPHSRCIPASESSRKGTGCPCPVPGDVLQQRPASPASHISVHETHRQVKAICDFMVFHSSFFRQRNVFTLHMESRLVVPHLSRAVLFLPCMVCMSALHQHHAVNSLQLFSVHELSYGKSPSFLFLFNIVYFF